MEKTKPKLSNDRDNKICWVAAILVGRSERENKQCFSLGPAGQFQMILIYLLNVEGKIYLSV
jgi:hypothetical protein